MALYCFFRKPWDVTKQSNLWWKSFCWFDEALMLSHVAWKSALWCSYELGPSPNKLPHPLLDLGCNTCSFTHFGFLPSLYLLFLVQGNLLLVHIQILSLYFSFLYQLSLNRIVPNIEFPDHTKRPVCSPLSARTAFCMTIIIFPALLLTS